MLSDQAGDKCVSNISATKIVINGERTEFFPFPLCAIPPVEKWKASELEVDKRLHVG